MFNLNQVYRWCDDYGGGIVFADSTIEAQEKIVNYLSKDRDPNKLIIWPWHLDEYYDEKNPDVLDVYGG